MKKVNNFEKVKWRHILNIMKNETNMLWWVTRKLCNSISSLTRIEKRENKNVIVHLETFVMKREDVENAKIHQRRW